MPMDVPDNSSDGTLEAQDTSPEETGFSTDEAVETEADESPDYSEDPLSFIESFDGIPDEVREAVKKGFLRQADYTRKTQALSSERSKLEDQRSVVDQILLSQREQKAEPAKEVEEIPDLNKGASPQDVIDYYVNKAVQSKLDALGIADTAKEIRPLAAQQRVVKAYQSWASEHPDVDHGSLAARVGEVLDSDPDLAVMAESNPDRAVRLAVKIAQVQSGAAKTAAKSKKRREAAPVAARKGTSVRKKERETPLEAATRALREQGVNI